MFCSISFRWGHWIVDWSMLLRTVAVVWFIRCLAVCQRRVGIAICWFWRLFDSISCAYVMMCCLWRWFVGLRCTNSVVCRRCRLSESSRRRLAKYFRCAFHWGTWSAKRSCRLRLSVFRFSTAFKCLHDNVPTCVEEGVLCVYAFVLQTITSLPTLLQLSVTNLCFMIG